MALYMVRSDHTWRHTWSEGGHYMAKGDHPWRRTWSGGSIHGAMDGPAGPTVGGTIYSMTDPRYNGPFKVTATRPPNVTIDTGDGRTKIVHLDRCKVVPNENLNPLQLEYTFVPDDPSEMDGNHEANCSDDTRFPRTQARLPRSKKVRFPLETPTKRCTTIHPLGTHVQKPHRYRETLVIEPLRKGK